MTFIEDQESAWRDIRERFSVNETPNGPGSFMENTENVRRELPEIIRRFNIASMVDVPCGDWNWMQHVDLAGVTYIGLDNDEVSIEANRARFPQHQFERVNILQKGVRIPAVDLILCRDLMIHLPNREIGKLLSLFRQSKSRYLLATHHPGADNMVELPKGGHDDRPGYWCRKVNLIAHPFNIAITSGPVTSIPERPGQELALFDLGEQ